MKTMLFFLVCAFFINDLAFASTPVEVETPVEQIYSPEGFDSNDNTEVIIEGYLPNLCHKSPTTRVTMEGDRIVLRVTALKYESGNPFCPEAIVPFVQKVSLGVMPEGKYEIVVNPKGDLKKEGLISVAAHNTNNVDEFIYANTEIVEKEMGTRRVMLKGYNPSDCFVLDDIKMIDNGKDVFSVLPIMKQVSKYCPQVSVPFTYEFDVPENLKADKVLLHVRAMNGHSVNTVFVNR